MASIPLPALDVRPPAPQPSPIEQMAQLQGLRNAQQEQQVRVQQMQGVDLENQQRQQALNAITSAMQAWDGKDYNDILPLVIKNGGSANAVMWLKSKILEQQQSMSTAAKNNADAASAQMAANKTRGDLLDGALTPLIDPKQVSDEDLPQRVMSTAQDLVARGVLDPAHAQQAEQLAQLPPAQIRQQLDLMRKSNLAQSQITEEAAKQAGINKDIAQAGEANTNAALAQTKIDWAKAHPGMAPGISPDEASLAAYLQANPGKTAQDYTLWKAQHSPTMILQGMSGGVAGAAGNQAPGGGTDWGKVAQHYGMTPGAFDQTAEKYYQSGQLPPIGRSPNAIAMNRDLMNRAAELHPGASLAENSAEFKANSESLKKMQSNLDAVGSFENTANKNIAMLEGFASKVPDMGTRWANIPVRAISGNMIGSENMAAFKTALAPVQAEAAKILNSANLTGTLSDSSRKELQDLVDGNMPYKSLVSSLKVLQQDFQNRHDSMQQTVTDIQNRLKGGGASAAPGGSAGNAAAPQRPSGVPANAIWNPQGNNGKGSWRMP